MPLCMMIAKGRAVRRSMIRPRIFKGGGWLMISWADWWSMQVKDFIVGLMITGVIGLVVLTYYFGRWLRNQG